MTLYNFINSDAGFNTIVILSTVCLLGAVKLFRRWFDRTTLTELAHSTPKTLEQYAIQQGAKSVIKK